MTKKEQALLIVQAELFFRKYNGETITLINGVHNTEAGFFKPEKLIL